MREIKIGDKFTYLEVLEQTLRKDPRGKFFLCKCKCGKIREVRADKLLSGKTKSCGCYASFKKGQNYRRTHNGSKTKEYQAWQGIKSRCLNPNDERYEDYGGRGITVCKEWVNDFEQFLKDVGKCPHKGWSLDRIKVNEGYYKENVRWADKYTQGANKRNSRYLEFNGEIKILAEWARLVKLKPNIISRRLKRGWSVERALTTKINNTILPIHKIYEPFTFIV